MEDDELLLVQMYGDFDVPVTLGVASDEERAEKIVRRHAKEYKLVEVEHGKFVESHSPTDVNFFYRKITLNKNI